MILHKIARQLARWAYRKGLISQVDVIGWNFNGYTRSLISVVEDPRLGEDGNPLPQEQRSQVFIYPGQSIAVMTDNGMFVADHKSFLEILERNRQSYL